MPSLRHAGAETLLLKIRCWLAELAVDADLLHPWEYEVSLKLNLQRSLQPCENFQIFYSSAIAHQLAQRLNLPLDSVIKGICGKIQPENAILPPSQRLGITPRRSYNPSFQIAVNPQGWIELALESQDLATWLQELSQSRRILENLFLPARKEALTSQNPPVKQTYPSLGLWQYTHARCCSLLRQAIAAELIRPCHPLAYADPVAIAKNVESWRTWESSQPKPIPWQALLHSPQSGLSLSLAASSEREFLLQILNVMDALATESLEVSMRISLAHQIQSICDGFTLFHRHCRILEPVQNQQLDLALARLGLISLCQRCLWELLQQGLGLAAPIWV